MLGFALFIFTLGMALMLLIARVLDRAQDNKAIGCAIHTRDGVAHGTVSINEDLPAGTMVVTQRGEEDGPGEDMKALIQRTAVAYGACDEEPYITQEGLWSWWADQERVAIDQVTYNPTEQTFSGWQGSGSFPVWTQK